MNDSDEMVAVTWQEPVFTDNSIMPVRISKSHTPGENFGVGITEVVYQAQDMAGNINVCRFNVTVKVQHRCSIPDPPLNGYIDCRVEGEAHVCLVSCLNGYAFLAVPTLLYRCTSNGWIPSTSTIFTSCIEVSYAINNSNADGHQTTYTIQNHQGENQTRHMLGNDHAKQQSNLAHNNDEEGVHQSNSAANSNQKVKLQSIQEAAKNDEERERQSSSADHTTDDQDGHYTEQADSQVLENEQDQKIQSKNVLPNYQSSHHVHNELQASQSDDGNIHQSEPVTGIADTRETSGGQMRCPTHSYLQEIEILLFSTVRGTGDDTDPCQNNIFCNTENLYAGCTPYGT